MASTRRHAHNTRRMNPDRSGSVCRHFLNGYCRFGPLCNYRHEWPTSPQVCRYYQKGGCWYGDHCRYRHVLQPETDAGVADRRRSVPVVSSSVARAPPSRRGSEPALLQAELMSRQECRSESMVNISALQDISCSAADERQSQDTDSDITASQESVQSSDVAQAGACNGRNEQNITSAETTEDGAGAAAASSAQRDVEEMEAFLQSKDVICGVCMDKVYEKMDPKNRVFGILPNCNHSFCLQCIITWRKTKDFGQDVVKSCPECRVRSAFYVPHKYWVEGQAKASVITAFKEKFGKRRCSHYTRYRRCPFKTDCLYQHDESACHTSLLYPEDEDDDYDDDDYGGVSLLNFLLAMALLSVNDDDDDNF